MNETEATIEILDRLGKRGCMDTWMFTKTTCRGDWITIWQLIVTKLVDGEFQLRGYLGDVYGNYKGFDVIERLAEFPWIAAKLAEPMEA